MGLAGRYGELEELPDDEDVIGSAVTERPAIMDDNFPRESAVFVV